MKVPNYVLLRAPKAFALYVIVMLSNFHTNKKKTAFCSFLFSPIIFSILDVIFIQNPLGCFISFFVVFLFGASVDLFTGASFFPLFS